MQTVKEFGDWLDSVEAACVSRWSIYGDGVRLGTYRTVHVALRIVLDRMIEIIKSDGGVISENSRVEAWVSMHNFTVRIGPFQLIRERCWELSLREEDLREK